MDSLLTHPTESVPLEVSCTTTGGHRVRPLSAEAGKGWTGRTKPSCPQPIYTSLVALRLQKECPHRKAAATWLHATALQLPKPMLRKTHVHPDPREGRAVVSFLHHCGKTPDRSNLGRKVSAGSQAEMVQSVLPGGESLSKFMVARAGHRSHHSRKWKAENAESKTGARSKGPSSPTNPLCQQSPTFQRFYSLQTCSHPSCHGQTGFT